jgi:hypothetical protein
VHTGNGGPLPEYDWGPSSGPRSSHSTPAGQVDGVHGEDWSSTAQSDLEPNGLDHSLQLLQSNTLLQESGSIAEASGTTATQDATTLECEECFETFPKPHLLKYVFSYICLVFIINGLQQAYEETLSIIPM